MNTTNTTIKIFTGDEKSLYNTLSIHPIQSWEWGEFKEKAGFKVIRFGEYVKNELTNVFQITYRKLPLINKTIGFLSNCPLPSTDVISFVKELDKENKAVYTKIEPKNILTKWKNIKGEIQEMPYEQNLVKLKGEELIESKPIFDQFTTIIDLTQNEEVLLQKMHHKTRYNIKVAQKKGVKVVEDSSLEGVKVFLNLNRETTQRQKFYLHNDEYFFNLYKEFEKTNTIRILRAQYNNKDLAVWILFYWNNKLYYPYGASSNENKEFMASNLIAWEAIKLGRKLNAKELDLWGCLPPNTSSNHKWFGFHKFKMGYGGDIYQFGGSWDLVSSKTYYFLYLLLYKIRGIILSLKSKT